MVAKISIDQANEEQLKEMVGLATMRVHDNCCLHMSASHDDCSCGVVVWALPGLQKICPCTLDVAADVCEVCIQRAIQAHGFFCLLCHGIGFVPVLGLPLLMQVVAKSMNVLVSVRNDGPGWRADIKSNQIEDFLIAQGWSDGYRKWFSLTEPPDYEPSPEEAMLRAVAYALEQQGATL